MNRGLYGRSGGKKATTWDGSSDGDSKPLIYAPNRSLSTFDDEFNDASGMSGPANGLAGRWLKHNLGTPNWLVLDDAMAPGCLLFQVNSATSDQAIYQACPSGDFTIMAQMDNAGMAGGIREMWFVFIVDASGNGVGFGVDNGDVYRVRQMSAWAQTATNATLGTGPYYGSHQLWLKRVGNTYTGGFTQSVRTRTFPSLSSALTVSFTPAYMGFGRTFAASTGMNNIVLDAFRLT